MKMKNKKIFIIGLIAVIAMISCKKESELVYESNDNVYFNFKAGNKDSIVYTFAYDAERLADTIILPVKVSGQRIHSDRKFKIEVMTDSSTAVADTHFKPFEALYTMAADSGMCHVPLVIYNKDPLLTSRSVVLRFKLIATSDLGTEIPALIYGKVIISNKLEEPVWWKMWLGSYYSEVKHKLFLITTGVIEMTMDGLDAPKNTYYVGLLNAFLNDPFSWVSNHPEYVLELRADENYDFYNSAIPYNRILLKKNTQTNKFHFIDEKGAEVN
jgi:hypothetical protein